MAGNFLYFGSLSEPLNSVVQNCWQRADVIPGIQEKDHFISHREYTEYIESGARTVIESLLNADCIPTSAVDLDELIDDLAHSRSEDPEPLIIAELEFPRTVTSYETAQQHLTEIIRYFTMLPIHEIKVPFSRAVTAA
jgi:hypothetical protein